MRCAVFSKAFVLVLLGGLSLVGPASAQRQAPRSVRPRTPPVATPPVAAPLRMTHAAGPRGRYSNRYTQSVVGQGEFTTITQLELETLRVRPDGSAEQRFRVTNLDATGVGAAATLPRLRAAVTGLAIPFTQDPRGRVTERLTPTVPTDVGFVLNALLQSVDLSPVLPVTPMLPGGTWNEARTLVALLGPGASFNLEVAQAYTLRSVENGRATVDVRMTFSTAPNTRVLGVEVSGSGEATEQAGGRCRGTNVRTQANGTLTVRRTIAGRTQEQRTTFATETTLLP